MRWSYIKELYESELRTSTFATGVFEPATDEGNKRWEDLRKRVVEHVSFKVHALANGFDHNPLWGLPHTFRSVLSLNDVAFMYSD